MHDRLLMYSSLSCSFMKVKKPPKQQKCPVCGPNPSIRSMEDSHMLCQYARGPSCVSGHRKSDLLNGHSLSCSEYKLIRDEMRPHILLDVRAKQQFELCSLDGAINIPLALLDSELDRVEELSNGEIPVYCICRRGVFSVSAAKLLQDASKSRPRIYSIKNIDGGLDAWREKIDKSFPKY